ncbi:DUF2382 domain-containing protein [Streptomyces formicae]|uniref:PRC-barrel domain-containing protein n=1 Tax=Streptomyces formicae TaxID=1616117 RepID=A0A291QJC0_9ACTN|nr:PRC and DUF2382 domain-containing protein [Streptomyces formicae]ATL31553.1 hypothetical protein KY5_6535 [Streptomyces formicae]
MTQGEAFSNPDALKGLTAYDGSGEKIGSVEQVYLDDRTGQAEWVTVKTGLFGTKESFVPLDGAARQDDTLRVRPAKDVVKDAPRVDADHHLDAAQEQELYAHYGMTRPDARARGVAGTAAGTPVAGTGGRADAAKTGHATGAAGAMSTGMGAESHGRHAGAREFATRGTAGADEKGESLVRSEERLRVGTEETESGHARLRKVVETEEVTTTVPVSHEEVRVVREPIREGERVRSQIGEGQTEVTLHAERAVVSKETVPVERVRLETERVTEQQEVSDTVRKERIEYDAPKDEGKYGKDTKGGDWRGKQGPSH